MTTKHFPPPVGRIPYISMGQSIRNNGNRHFAKAQRHAEQGNKEYAFGSFSKAKRNWKRADEIDSFVRGDWPLKPEPETAIEILFKNRIDRAHHEMQLQFEADLYG